MRKQSQQARSRHMVERLIQAARIVLVTDGYDAFSTNRAAEHAGVSPGSLYQYFANKEELVSTVIDRWAAEISDRVTASVTDQIGLNDTHTVRAVADALLTALEADAPLLRIVWEQLPAGRHRIQQRALEERVRELLTVYLAASGSARGNHAATAWVLVMGMENIAVRWVLDQPPLSREVLLAEMTALAGAITVGSV